MLVSRGYAQDPPTKYWIFFKDKGLRYYAEPEQLYKQAEAGLSVRSLQRRMKVRGAKTLLDYTDLPVYRPYLDSLRQRGIRPVVVSKWLNAVSAYLSTQQVEEIRSLPFVRRIQKVAVFTRKPEEVKPLVEERPLLRPFPNDTTPHLYDYGYSHAQNALIRVPDAHDRGLTGEGVLITMLDTGYNYRQHEAFQHLKVIAEWDFINGDSITVNEPGQDANYQHNHGTYTLSVIAGFAPGKLIGPAFGATYALAKTEYVPTETRIEEDYWVAGIEWADSLGADIVSSSLGYWDFEDGFSYTYEDLNGDVAVTTVAADLAASKGIVVCNAAGNSGPNPSTIITPADGDSVIAVGAVRSDGSLATFSSRGPTADGRIKPDVVAMGVSVVGASPNNPGGYSLVSGTSMSTPQVAGVCALILQAHPQLTPWEVREALRNTASLAEKPNNDYGWGLIDALRAVEYHGPIRGIPAKYKLYQNFENPFRDITRIPVDLPEEGFLTLKVYNVLGQVVATIAQGHYLPGQKVFLWGGRDSRGEPLPSGVYFYRLQINGYQATKKLIIAR